MSNVLMHVVLGITLASAVSAWSDDAAVLRKLAQAAPHLTVAGISTSPVAGIHEVEIEEDLSRLYVSTDGNHLFAGDMYAILADGLVNLTEARRETQRRKALGELGFADMIVFAPADETRAVVYAFTDVDCYFCRQLHGDIGQLNGFGIEVRYVAYPRGGPGTPTYDKMVSIWCAANPHQAITAAKRDEDITEATCDNPVAEQFALGQSLHIGGTPALLTERGELIAGYFPPDELARRLGLPQ